MKWKLDDTFLEKTKEKKVCRIKGIGDNPLPWWFHLNRLRPLMKLWRWKLAVKFGACDVRAEEGYKLGFIVGGHAYVSEHIFHYKSGAIIVNGQNWTFFMVDPSGEVLPVEIGNEKIMEKKERWVSTSPESLDSEHLDGWTIVD